jgi:hypothetical protein
VSRTVTLTSQRTYGGHARGENTDMRICSKMTSESRLKWMCNTVVFKGSDVYVVTDLRGELPRVGCPLLVTVLLMRRFALGASLYSFFTPRCRCHALDVDKIVRSDTGIGKDNTYSESTNFPLRA